ncbi:MAG TPA: Trp family transcriptional regulator [Candidatus Paceibacterota bacterium]
MKRRPKDLSDKEMMATLDVLYTAASSVTSRDAVKLFLRDLLTPSERVMLGRRLIIARMLLRGTSYDTIGKKLKVGRATIGRVHKWLQDQFPGFETAVKEMEREFDRRARKAPVEPFSYAWLKRKYPLHFLLFPEPKTKKHSYGEY